MRKKPIAAEVKDRDRQLGGHIPRRQGMACSGHVEAGNYAGTPAKTTELPAKIYGGIAQDLRAGVQAHRGATLIVIARLAVEGSG